MAKPSPLEIRWQQLMSLCARESAYKTDGSHPKLLKLVSADIDRLARTMGFSDRQIATREFRAERDGERITRIHRDSDSEPSSEGGDG
jgi:hypothetical protein